MKDFLIGCEFDDIVNREKVRRVFAFFDQFQLMFNLFPNFIRNTKQIAPPPRSTCVWLIFKWRHPGSTISSGYS